VCLTAARAFVFAGGELAGIVTTTDIAHSLVPSLDEVIMSFG